MIREEYSRVHAPIEPRGIGMMMVYAMFSFDAPVVWMTILFVCGMALAGYTVVAALEALVVRWDTGGKVGG